MRENKLQKFLDVRDVAERFGVSAATIWRWSRLNVHFPKPVKLGPGTTRWLAPDIARFESLMGEGSL